mmetsp:Transcript_18175/g.39288  ORF Transcript_18175/g.39288 Transcript_18175/m.39288 type:complete len:810 (-) Transcript_18175:158-2587(-)|eukprot:CAMPEP_0172317762 /NCGR_PEP_ID=MMETSP1058-20130122/32665_1 /TAXON_ID=83371 /ORGANISM="Detonula confervacea, Strain CCMP 353" /LENGTH=809 /DNA_ID=CAMNT_0013032393 /DNA_START=197 /DNA_END=2626 /DNA_ORIENTATION=+
MFHYTNQNTALSSSRRLASSDRLSNDSAPPASNGVYFHPYDGGAPTRAATSTNNSDASGVGHHHHSHARSASDFAYHGHSHQYGMEEEDDEEEEPMDILYEQEVSHHHHRHHSEPAYLHSPISNLEVQITSTADHLMGLLQREANDYSVPLPVRYYPTEFVDVDSANDEQGDGDKSKKATIGPWRKRIASWMYDVVDHFQYDRNVVSIALRYIDQYVGHLLVENAKGMRRTESGIGISRGSSSSSSGQPIKRRHFQLIAVTSLYLAIKVHGELMENDPITGAEYDVVASLVHEVDGRAFLGKPLAKDDNDTIEEDDEDSSSLESNEELRTVHHKISDLKRRQRKGRWGSRLSAQFGLPLAHSANRDCDRSHSEPISTRPKMPKAPHSALPYKPRKRGMLGGPLRLHSFVELSRGLFTAKDISDTETKILKALNYVVNPPTSRRFTGELLRLLALCYCGAVDECTANAAATASAAERMLGLDRKEILSKVLKNACAQIEGAASVPSLSIGCLPSVLAYGAMLNAVEEEFEKIQLASAGASSKDAAMEMEKNSSPQLEDFQRHYRRYSRNQSPLNSATSAVSKIVSDKELFLEAWKEQFLVTVFHATNCFLSPDSEDIFKVRELLLDQVQEDAAAATSPTSSPTEINKQEGTIKKRSPRSPRSVMFNAGGTNPRMLRGSSFFSRGSSNSSSVSLLSPYDSRGRASTGSGIGSSSNANVGESSVFRRSSASTAHAAHPHRAYYKQTSEPIAEATAVASSRFTRSQTPDESHFRNHEMTRQRVGSNYEAGSSWRSSTGEAFQPPNPNPLFFSA